MNIYSLVHDINFEISGNFKNFQWKLNTVYRMWKHTAFHSSAFLIPLVRGSPFFVVTFAVLYKMCATR